MARGFKKLLSPRSLTSSSDKVEAEDSQSHVSSGTPKVLLRCPSGKGDALEQR